MEAEALQLQGEVRALEDNDLRELRVRLAATWPAIPFKDLVTADGERFWLTSPARAWVFLAPPADMPLTDEQWAQLATNPVIYNEQSDWLRRQATGPRIRRALALMTDNRARARLRLLTAAPPRRRPLS